MEEWHKERMGETRLLSLEEGGKNEYQFPPTYLSKVTASLDKVNLSPSVTLSIGMAASIITNTPETALMVFTDATVVLSKPRA